MRCRPRSSSASTLRGMRGQNRTSAPSSAWFRSSAASRCRSESSLSPACRAGSRVLDRQTVFLLGLIIPAISVLGVLLIRAEKAERRPLDLRILGGGLAFGALVIALGVGGLPWRRK